MLNRRDCLNSVLSLIFIPFIKIPKLNHKSITIHCPETLSVDYYCGKELCYCPLIDKYGLEILKNEQELIQSVLEYNPGSKIEDVYVYNLISPTRHNGVASIGPLDRFEVNGKVIYQCV